MQPAQLFRQPWVSWDTGPEPGGGKGNQETRALAIEGSGRWGLPGGDTLRQAHAGDGRVVLMALFCLRGGQCRGEVVETPLATEVPVGPWVVLSLSGTLLFLRVS